ncbi:MAG: VIT1/CCC1 transporter family protein [Parcubacteria group bacterium]|jgi:VIT1/CCC1 family predicted Fe2+/Mn2+ transporter
MMELEDKIKGVIAGLFGSIIASFGVALGASLLTTNYWTVILSGLIVGLASSFANAFGPLVSSTRMHNSQMCSSDDLGQAFGSCFLTFIFVGMPLISYVLINDLSLARIISIITGLVLLFILGVHEAQLEHRSPLVFGFTMMMVGVVCAYVFYLLANLLK